MTHSRSRDDSLPTREPPTTALPRELQEALAARGVVVATSEALGGDLSARHYTRLRTQDGASLILATYPQELLGACARFAKSTRLLDAAGVRVPHIVASDCAAGWMLLEDLGVQTLAEHGARPGIDVADEFRDAAGAIARIATLPEAAVAELNPPLDAALMERELAQTWDLFLVPQGLVADAAGAARLRAALDEICGHLAAAVPVPCHRDFMARNLMPLGPGRVGVLDHQDLRLGPPSYDLASLLNDTLFPPPALAEELLGRAVPGAAERAGYHRAAAQRTLKAVGTYASFARRGAIRHVPLIAPTLRRFVEHLRAVPDTAAIGAELAASWAGAMATGA
jgi:aminoglycoside/choline kinase family phosphotransferase